MEMEKEYYLKAGELTGHCQLARFHKVVAEAEELIAIKKAIGSGVHKAYGLTAKEYSGEKCGIPYSTYHMYETEMGRIGKDLYILKGVIDLSPGDIQALAALPEESKVRVDEKKNIIEIEGKKIPVDNSHELIETIHAILKRAELAEKEKQLVQKEAKHAQKSLEGVSKEIEKERQAYQKEIADLKAKVADPRLPESFEEFVKVVERKVDEIFMLTNRHDFDEVFGNVENSIEIKRLYLKRLGTVMNQINSCIAMMSKVMATDLEQLSSREI